MAKLTGAKKKAFLERMAKGRKKAGRTNPKKKAAKKKPAGKKAGKLTGAKKAAFLKRMAGGRKKAGRPAKKKNAGPASLRKTKKLFKKQSTFHGRQGTDMRRRLKSHKTKGRATKATKRGRRRNSSDAEAEAMYETFHQAPPGHIVEYEEQVHYPAHLAELGKLIELRADLDSANRDFPFTRFGNCQVICTPDGANIYFNGGDQSIDYEALDIASDKDTIELGPCRYICYLTTKGFHDFQPTRYFHRFGEEDGITPVLAYDRLNKRLFLIGGNYTVKREGIVN